MHKESSGGSGLIRRIVFAIMSVGLVLCALFFLVPKEEDLPPTPQLHQPEPRYFDTAVVEKGDLVEELRIRCDYDAIREERLSFDISGIEIETVYVTTGDTVEKGDVLIELEMKELEAELSQCHEDLEILQLQLKQTNELMTQELAAHEAYLSTLTAQQLKTTVTSSERIMPYTEAVKHINDNIYLLQLKMNEIEKDISERQIIAEFDGVVSYIRDLDKGDVSERGQSLITVSDNSTPAFISTNEEKGLFEEGDEAQLFIEDIPYTVHAISAGEEDPEDDKQEYYFIMEDSDVIIPDGTYGYITVITKEAKDILYIPEEAVKNLNGKTTVYYQNENGIRDYKHVTTGELIDGFYEITDGVTQGEQIIIG